MVPNTKKKNYTEKEKGSYYSKRVSDSKLSQGQRTHAKKMVSKIFGVGTVNVRKTVKVKSSRLLQRKKKLPNSIRNSIQLAVGPARFKKGWDNTMTNEIVKDIEEIEKQQPSFKKNRARNIRSYLENSGYWVVDSIKSGSNSKMSSNPKVNDTNRYNILEKEYKTLQSKASHSEKDLNRMRFICLQQDNLRDKHDN